MDAVTTTAHRGVQRVSTSAPNSGAEQPARKAGVFKRLAFSAATAFLAVNLWSGAPLVALWVGSLAVGQKQLNFQAVAVVIVVLGILVFAIAFALAKLNAAYDRLLGRRTRERRLTWLRSYRDEDWRHEVDKLEGVTLLEGIVMANVWLVQILLLVWFFAFAGSPLPS
jgi:hypothetical protein